jgi:hypothetical protein
MQVPLFYLVKKKKKKKKVEYMEKTKSITKTTLFHLEFYN